MNISLSFDRHWPHDDNDHIQRIVAHFQNTKDRIEIDIDIQGHDWYLADTGGESIDHGENVSRWNGDDHEERWEDQLNGFLFELFLSFECVLRIDRAELGEIIAMFGQTVKNQPIENQEKNRRNDRMEKDRVEGEIMFLPLIIRVRQRWLRARLPNTHERMDGNILISVQEERRKKINHIGEKDQDENEDQH